MQIGLNAKKRNRANANHFGRSTRMRHWDTATQLNQSKSIEQTVAVEPATPSKWSPPFLNQSSDSTHLNDLWIRSLERKTKRRGKGTRKNSDCKWWYLARVIYKAGCIAVDGGVDDRLLVDAEHVAAHSLGFIVLLALVAHQRTDHLAGVLHHHFPALFK